MVFAGVLMGQNTPQGGGFEGGDITVANLEEALQSMSTGAPVDVISGTNGKLILGGNDFGGYNYSIWNGGSYNLSIGNVSGSFINNNPDRHALVCFKGNTTLNLNNITTVRKTTVVIYCNGNLTLTNNLRVKGCIQSSAGMYTTNPSSFPLDSNSNMTGSCGNGGAGGDGGGSGGAGGIFSGGAGGGGGPLCGNASQLKGADYGGRGGYNNTGGFSSWLCGGGAGNPRGPGYDNNTTPGDVDPQAQSITGGTIIFIVTGTLTQSSGTVSVHGGNGGRGRAFNSSQASGGGGSGGGRIFVKSGSGTITSKNTNGGSRGTAIRNGNTVNSGSNGVSGGNVVTF